MTPIAKWLGSLGLSEYADRFAENRIDLSILPDLTDQDLKELGVVLGDRRRIAEITGAQPELLAGHCTQAGQTRCPSCSTASAPRSRANKIILRTLSQSYR